MKKFSDAQTRFYIATILLGLAGIGLTIYKNRVLHFPLFTGSTVDAWTVEAHISFEADGGPVEVSLAVPDDQADLSLCKTKYIAKGYTYETAKDTPIKEHRRAIWKKESAKGLQNILYRVSVYDTAGKRKNFNEEDVPLPSINLPEDKLVAIDNIIKIARESSGGNNKAFVTELLKMLNSNTPSDEVSMLLGAKPTRNSKMQLARTILARDNIRSVIAKGFVLDKTKKNQKLMNVLCVGEGDKWNFFTLASETYELPERFLFWQRGGDSLLDVIGGKNVKVKFSILHEKRSASRFAVENAEENESFLVTMSIYSLPIAQQSAFKTMLMVPLGALIVVLMRNIVGISTSGTFMPILIALSFLETRVLPGVIMFFLIVSAGLAVRAYLTRLNLLLIPRISAVVIVVVFIMALFSIVSNKIGLERGMQVTLFPMIVLSWTVERLCVLWEEQGHKEVLIRGGGALLVAVIAYLVMSNSLARHLMFTFPELMLTLMAIILLLGRYSGYRLSEIFRFKAFEESDND